MKIFKIPLYSFLCVLFIMITASIFVDKKNKTKAFVSPNSSIYKLNKINDYSKSDISPKEERFISKTFGQLETINKDSEEIDKVKTIINSLINKGILSKEHTSYHLFGTDHDGRDLLKMLTVATRNNISLSLVVVFCSISIGMLIGILQGYILDREYPVQYMYIKNVITFFIQSITSIPMLVWIFVIYLCNVLVFHIYDPYWKIMWTFIFLGIIYYSSILSLTIEKHIISLKEFEFLASSELMGLSKLQIVIHHIIRTNLAPLLISQSILIIIQTIMLEITISFHAIGYGFMGDIISYGSLVSHLSINPSSINMIVPIIFAGIFCSILNLIILNFQSMDA